MSANTATNRGVIFFSFDLLQVRRMEKKANKVAFKSEKIKQELAMMHAKHQRGKKL